MKKASPSACDGILTKGWGVACVEGRVFDFDNKNPLQDLLTLQGV
jgi:hypothetical protein